MPRRCTPSGAIRPRNASPSAEPPRPPRSRRRGCTSNGSSPTTRGTGSRAAPSSSRRAGTLIGDCGLFVSPDQPDVELAYALGRAWWGRGYATEAAAACVRAGFEQLGLERIVADVREGHSASIRVLEKVGFELERVEGGKGYYVITRASRDSNLSSGHVRETRE